MGLIPPSDRDGIFVAGRMRSLFWLSAIVGLVTFGCGARTDLSCPDGSAPAPNEPSAFVVRMTVWVNAYEHDWAAATERLVVEVEDADGQPLRDVVVHAGPAGSPTEIPYRETTGRFVADRVGYSEVYEVSVTNGADEVGGIVAGTAPHTTSIDPDPVAVGAVATVRWAPSDEPGIGVNVQILPPDAGWLNFDGESEESGSYELPADTFSTPGAYEVSVVRFHMKNTQLSGPASFPSSFASVAAFDYHATYAE